jgi:GlpG protein
MRKVGDLPTERDANAFHSFLVARGIENEAEAEDGGAFSIWIHDDNQRTEAARMLESYRSNPGAPEFRQAPVEAARIRAETEKAERRRRSAVIDEARIGYEQNFLGQAWVPILFVVLSIAATFYTGFFAFADVNVAGLQQLHISRLPYDREMPGASPVFLPEVRDGEVWRLITPIFLHGDWAHILFNMMWLVQLGRFIETRFGPYKLLALILTVGIGSNIAEYLWSSPYFGGMSGVNYGLFGFLWMKGRFGRDQTWQLPPQTVQFMLVWMVLCYTGVLGPVANAVHTVGLLIGAACGFASARIVPWAVGGGR